MRCCEEEAYPVGEVLGVVLEVQHGLAQAEVLALPTPGAQHRQRVGQLRRLPQLRRLCVFEKKACEVRVTGRGVLWGVLGRGCP